MTTQISVRIILICALALSFTVLASSHDNPSPPPLLLVSFDGFRWDYLTRARLPNLERIVASGVHVTDGVKNVFDTSTLPNHWTLVTGLYPESHGVIGNYLRDAAIEKKFIPKYVDQDYQNDPRYYDAGGEPIWATNQYQGGRSGSVMWWGSENTVKWSRPTFHMPYDDNVNFTARVDVLVDWLTHPYPINLGLIYFFEPDFTGHAKGPESSDVTEKIKEADKVVGYLLEQLERRRLLEGMNIIITSDHGMTSTSSETLIFLDDFISFADYDILMKDYTIVSIFPHAGKFDQVYKPLKAAAEQKDSHFRVYLAKDIPERFHMKNSHRVPPIIALADLHYRLVANASRGDHFPLAGVHGYDNEEKDMRPFFVAMGPSFKKGITLSSFEIVDIYPLVCRLLGIKPAPNNGSLDIVSQLLLQEHGSVSSHNQLLVILAASATVLVAILALSRNTDRDGSKHRKHA